VAIAAGTAKSMTVQLVAKVAGTLKGTVKDKTNNPIANALVVLRRGSATGSILDSVRTNVSGGYTFPNVVPGGPNYWVAVITANGSAVRENVIVASGATVIVDFSFTVSSLDRSLAYGFRGLRIVPVGDRLELELGVSASIRTVSVFEADGMLKYQVSVPAGQSRTAVPASFSPENGFLFQVK